MKDIIVTFVLVVGCGWFAFLFYLLVTTLWHFFRFYISNTWKGIKERKEKDKQFIEDAVQMLLKERPKPKPIELIITYKRRDSGTIKLG